ncbi:hypothetical protein U8335_01785 [Roseiconus lacunae]|uniref:tetratricopeptide repeat protein n=1 Tax=Roseiconus lacunae TaxID=2605694 RepID=UPI003086A96D|nr:hypothetical protein U8335_01785 [Stieleria sp. HD01]
MAHRKLTLPRSLPFAIPAIALFVSLLSLTGCQDDTALVRKIQYKRQVEQQSQSQQDHLGDVFALLEQYVELEPKKARRQIAYHLNRWSESQPATATERADLVKTIEDLFPPQELEKLADDSTYQPGDAEHLRDCFLFHSLYSWIDAEHLDERLLADWFTDLAKTIPEDQIDQLKTATRLFDWTVRNVAFEPDVPTTGAPPGPQFPAGMTFRGPGYRQTDYQTLMRGTGDGLQRAGVFTQLCRQANIAAAVIGTIDGTSGAVTPYFVGVLVGEEIYLFEPRLGIFVPGPGQVGIATLAQARRDELVLRRLSIAGLDEFTYPISKSDVQQCVALFNFSPVTVSPRMELLQNGLTGNRRMSVYADADELAKRFDAVTGVASTRLWNVPVLAEMYRAICEQHAERDPIFNFWYVARWAMLEADFDSAKNLAHGRWLHLLGQFSDVEEENIKGARTLYLEQRAPEFEIEDLRIDVDLQAAYGIRRADLDVSSEQFDQRIAEIQTMMRLGKRTATYWLSLLQADDDRTETAQNWIDDRVLDESQASIWVEPARYNLGRLAEALGDTDRAIEIYKRENAPQEHGSRIRARLVAKQTDD